MWKHRGGLPDKAIYATISLKITSTPSFLRPNSQLPAPKPQIHTEPMEWIPM